MTILLQQTSAHRGYAIIDDRRGGGRTVTLAAAVTVAERRHGLAESAVRLRRLVLDAPLLLPIQGAAGVPLAFTIQDIANGLPAGGAAVACQVAGRVDGVFVAAGPIA